uniref:Translin-associated factor X-interacting protein 1 N-terminal domain-containing protein n=1 Tax=Pygocentrus nattereri TaxID=42514 RepID=A0AAR2J3F9_PYGNA
LPDRKLLQETILPDVIDYATAYEPILTAIKKEYDEFIAAVKTNDRKAKLARGKLKALVTQPTSLMYCLKFEESLNPEALDEHLKFFKQKRADLLSKKKSQYVPAQVKRELVIKMKSTLNQRDELGLENNKLQLRWCCGFVIHRFSDLFEAGEYEAAAYHAAKSPHGVLRNMETMERFKCTFLSHVLFWKLPPALLFFQALTISVQPGKRLPGEVLSLEGVRCALQHGYIQLVTFWVTQHRLTYSEELGDVICSHGAEDPRVADTCLALAHIVYTACGVLRKAALSMCRRGLISGAFEFIYKSRDFTVGETRHITGCPSLDLMQDFTQLYEGKPALLSVGFICHSLLKSDLEDLAFQLLEKIYKTILNDVMCSAESWSEIATRCEQRGWHQLAQKIISILLSQPGAVCLSQEQDSVELMEHVFM